MDIESNNVGLTFVNYNYAFNTFYESYKNLCLVLSEKNKISDLVDIHKLISSFVYEYDYTIKNNSDLLFYRTRLREIKDIIEANIDYQKLENLDYSILKNKIIHHKIYYNYFLMYLDLLGTYTKELTNSFMPNTNLQKKIIKFSNNQTFFEKFTEHKKIVLEGISNFKLSEFSRSYNQLITFFYAYSLFINKDDKIILDELFSLIISLYLNEDLLKLLSNDNFTTSLYAEIKEIEDFLHNSLLYANSIMNNSFSNYDVLPKIQKKVYIDKTLI